MNKITLMDVPGQFKAVEEEVLPEIKRVLESGRYILGPEVKKFEDNFAKYCQVKHCIGINSGTDSLHLALKALGIKPGDEVITVPNTFTATAEAIVMAGGTPVFCDVDPQTMNMDPKSLASKMSDKTKAVIPVHLHGNPVDMDEVYKLTSAKGIWVVEDAAQAHGGYYKDKIIGSLQSEFTSFSFHPVKNLGAFGDGGALVTNDDKLAEMIRKLINHGRADHHHHDIVGTTARLDTLQAAILDIKLKYLDGWIQKKSKLVEIYIEKLTPLLGKLSFIKTTNNSQSAHHVFAILTDQRDALSKFLAENEIETGMHYPVSLHLQPAYAFLGYKKGDLPNAEKYAETTLSLPLFPHMTHEQLDYVISKIYEFFKKSA